MNESEFVQALAAAKPGPVKDAGDAEAVLEALASIVWHQLEHGRRVECPRIGAFGAAPAERGRRAVTFEPATELEVAVNRHHVIEI